MELEEMKAEICKMSYGEAMNELEGIVGKMQSDDCDIDKLSGYTTRAMLLLQVCKEKLQKTDDDIKQCLETLS